MSDTENHNNTRNQDGILCTKILQVQNKRYYFDIKEHEFGRFLKLAETAQNGRKSRLVIPMYLLPEMEQLMQEFCQHLDDMPDFQKCDRNAGGDNRDQSNEAAVELKAGMLERGRRRYYFNLKENNRGRYLRVKAIGDIPQNSRGGRRSGGGPQQNGRRTSKNSYDNDRNNVRAIILPAVGVQQFKDYLTELWKNYAVDVEHDKVALADKNVEIRGTSNDKLPTSGRFASKTFRKVLFLDAGENSRGIFARMTEQQNNFRESITIPSVHFEAIGNWFLEASKTCHCEEEVNGDLAEQIEQLQVGEEVVASEEHEEEDIAGKSRRREHASDSEE